MSSMHFHTASTWKRLMALAIDGAVANILMLPATINLFVALGSDGVVEIPVWLFVSTCLLVLFYHWLFLYFFGRTIGKYFLGLRVISLHGDAGLGFMQAGVRVIADYLSVFFSLAPRALVFFRLDRRHLSDWIAETRVVQMHPRPMVPHRRWILGSVLVLYFSITGFYSLYQVIQNCEISRGKIIYYAKR